MNNRDKREYRAAIARDNHSCVYCGNTTIEVHHIVFRSHGGMNIRQNLVCLCKAHHDMVHSDEPKWRDDLLDKMRAHYGMMEMDDLKSKNKWQRRPI